MTISNDAGRIGYILEERLGTFCRKDWKYLAGGNWVYLAEIITVHLAGKIVYLLQDGLGIYCRKGLAYLAGKIGYILQ